MAHTLVCVKTADCILDYAVYSRDAAPVKFAGHWYCLSLRKDPCTGHSQYIVISGFPNVGNESHTEDFSKSESENMSQNTNKCHCDKQNEKEPCQFCDRSKLVSFMLFNVNCKIVCKLPRNLACCSFKELVRSRTFRKRFIKYMKNTCRVRDVRHQTCKCEDVYKVVSCGIELPLLIEVCLKDEPAVINVCLAWCYRLEGLARKRLILEETMAWLSTLGGGFSSLGDYFLSFSEQAGKISVTQLQIAKEMGDPIMASKCRMFYALSLMQAGKLRHSKKMLRREHSFAVQYKNKDSRLVDICVGMWSKLQYFYSTRKKRSINSKKTVHVTTFLPKCCLRTDRQRDSGKESRLMITS